MAAWLGISKSKLDKLSCARKIPFFKMPGSSLRIYEVDEVARWMTSDGNHVRAYTDDDIIELQRKAGEYMRELR
ncbi:MAG: hypothetical protein IJV33_09250 [Bacteroidaceae bacterium]|nr:hypothetical protein [Bacteroidaceae bacterium]